MGSAVSKPLTRRRGKVKSNELVVGFSGKNAEGDLNGNCRASVDCAVKSLTDAVKTLPKPVHGKSCETGTNSTRFIRKICCTNIYWSGRSTPSESIEELYLTQYTHKRHPSFQTKAGRSKGSITGENYNNTGDDASPVKSSVNSFVISPDTQRQDTSSEELNSSPGGEQMTMAPVGGGNQSPLRPATAIFVRSRNNAQVFDCSCLPGTCETGSKYPSTKLYQNSHRQQENDVCHVENGMRQKILCCPGETGGLRQWSRFLRNSKSTAVTENGLGKDSNNVPVDVNSSGAHEAHESELNPEHNENIRQQLDNVAVNHAERKGGVAFFIPVTDDGIQPQADEAVVVDRLTKPKKACLNYEERMILANINRQAQLYKRIEFAVRDIQNVKGAAPVADLNDRSKIDEDLDMEFERFVSMKWGEDTEFDMSLTEEEDP